MLVCESKWCFYACFAETFFTFGNERYSNNSLITIDVLESNSSTLKCTTENQACCTDFEVSWNYPNGSVINHTMTQNQSIILNITSELLISKGIYHCIIPGLSNVSNHLYIGIFEVSEGTNTYMDTIIHSITLTKLPDSSSRCVKN